MIAEQTFTRNAAGSGIGGGRPADVELQYRVRSVSNKFADNVHIIANEPTLACYRLQEHSRRSLPGLIEKGYALATNDRVLEGRVFGLDYDIRAVKDIYSAEARFRSVQEMLKNSIYMKQELDKNRTLRENTTQDLKENEKETRKMKRFSGSYDVRAHGANSISSSVSSSEIRTTPLAIGNSTGTGSLNYSPRKRSGSMHSTNSLYYKIGTPTK